MYLLIIVLFVYFIREQFEYNKVSRWSYAIMPLFALASLSLTFKLTATAVWQLLLIVAVSLVISFYQAKYTQVRVEQEKQFYFTDQAGNEVPIYRKIVTAKGGIVYLCGWLLILIAQFLNEWLFEHVPLDGNEIFSEVVNEVLRDLLSSIRFGDSDTGWSLWALIGFSSLGYTYFLSKKSDAFREVVFKKVRKNEVIESNSINRK